MASQKRRWAGAPSGRLPWWPTSQQTPLEHGLTTRLAVANAM